MKMPLASGPLTHQTSAWAFAVINELYAPALAVSRGIAGCAEHPSSVST